MVASGDGRVAPMASSSSHGTSQNPGGGSAYAAALAAPPGAWTISRQEVGGKFLSMGWMNVAFAVGPLRPPPLLIRR